jgi:hypothetical protein
MSFEEAVQLEASPLTAGAGGFGRPHRIAHLHR